MIMGLCVFVRLFVVSLMSRAFFFFQAEDGIRDLTVTEVQTCALPISDALLRAPGVCRVRRLAARGVAAHVLVQQPLRCVPGVRRARLARRDRPRAAGTQTPALAQGGGAGARGPAGDDPLPPDPPGARPAAPGLARFARGEAPGAPAGRDPPPPARPR